MFFCKFKKVIAGICIGFGIGMLFILFLPPAAWLTLIAVALVISGLKTLFKK